MWKPLRARRVVTSEEGFTFLEVMITLALLSIAFVAILSAVVTMISTTDQHKVLAKGENAVRTLGEVVKSETANPFVPCAASTPASTYQAKAVAAGNFSGLTPTVISVKSWDGNSPATFTDCPAADNGAQLITVRVTGTSLGRPVTQTLTVIKRKP